jgi:hypothetical protein
MKPNQKVKFKGIEGMLFTPCQTTVFKLHEYPCTEDLDQDKTAEMIWIEHPEGHYYPAHSKNLLFVNILDHLEASEL